MLSTSGVTKLNVKPVQKDEFIEPSKIRVEQLNNMISTWGPMREISRNNMGKTLVPDNDDLFGILSKYPTVDDLKSWIKAATDQTKPFHIPTERGKERVADVDEHGAPKQRQRGKKDVLTVVLAYPITRIIALLAIRGWKEDWLNNGKSNISPDFLSTFDETRDLKDYYIKVYENGPKIAADDPESVQMQIICQLPVIERPFNPTRMRLYEEDGDETNSNESNSSVSSSRSNSSGGEIGKLVIPRIILMSLNSIIDYDNTKERKKTILDILRGMENMSTENLQQILDKVREMEI